MPYLLCNVKFAFNWFYNTEQSLEILILKIEMLLQFQIKANIEIIGFWLMHFAFALDLADIYLWNIDLLETHLDLLGKERQQKEHSS